MTSLSDPPCLIEHELYVYVQTLFGFFIRCPHGNVHLMSVSFQGGGDTLIFSYIRRLGPFNWAQNFEDFNIFLWFSEKWIFFRGYEEYFSGAWNSWYFWANGRCGARAYAWRTNQSTSPGVSVRCYVDWRAHLNVKQNVDPDELTYQKSLFKKKKL